MPSARVPSIFISYSHADEAWKDRLVKHLQPLEREGLARLWHDRTLRPGDAWYEQIGAGMDGSSVAVLLVSADFLASDFISREEVPRLAALAAERGVRILPVLVSACGWQDVPALSRLQMWPAHLSPLARVADPDEELAGLASELRRLVRPRAAAETAAPPAFVPPDPDKVFLSGLPRTGSLLLGRDTELRLLDQAWSDGASNVASVLAWGGAGKSALINGWLGQMAQDHFRGARRVYAWSFDRQGTSQRAASADEFFAAAFRWFRGGESVPTDPLERAERLAARIRGERTLLVLDGMEPLQHHAGVDEGQIRDPALSVLLRELAMFNEGGLCLVSSRLPVRDLDAFGEQVVRMPLERLSVEAGAELLRARGVRGAGMELCRAVEEYGGHALALNLLAGYLVDVHEGDVARRSEVPASDLVGEGAERVLAAYDEWYGGRPAGAALRLMGFFDRPATPGALKALMRAPAIPALTEPLQRVSPAEWARTVSTLRRASLLARPNDDAPGELDTHPLVRAYYERQVSQETPEAWREANGRLYEHYRDAARPLPATLDEMQPLLLALVHGARAGRHRDAIHEVLLPRVLRGEEAFVLNRLGAYGALLASTAAFCEPGDWSRPADGVPEEEHLRVLPAIAQCLLMTRGYGSQEMQDCFERMHELAVRLGSTGNMDAVLLARWRTSLLTRPLSQTLLRARDMEDHAMPRSDAAFRSYAQNLLCATYCFMGKIDQAQAHARAGIREWNAGARPAPESEYAVSLVANLTFLGKLLWQGGQGAEARTCMAAAVRTAREDVGHASLLMALWGSAYLSQFFDDGADTLAAATEMGDVAAAQGNRFQSAVALVLRGWAIYRLGSAAEGAATMQQGIASFRALGLGLNLSYYYSLLAEAQLALGELDEAAASLQLATRSAERYEEVWWSAETLRLAGVLRHRRGDVEGAAAAFRGAMKLARGYGSRALEARAADSLVRLRREQGGNDQAAAAVRPAFHAAAG
jgi:tetratricopeptide (TPR) repeat protein